MSNCNCNTISPNWGLHLDSCPVYKQGAGEKLKQIADHLDGECELPLNYRQFLNDVAKIIANDH